MKKKQVLAIGLALSLALGTAALAAGELKNISVVPGMKLAVNGEEVTPVNAAGKPIEVFAYNDATYVPLRFISEAFGLKVGYDPETLTASVDEQEPGTAAASVKGFAEPGAEPEVVTVTVKTAEGKITEVTAQSTRTSPIGQPALDQMPKAMVEKNSVEVDTVAGATGTSTAVLEAARKAMAKITEQNTGAGDLDAWALANGYVKAADYNIVTGVDAITSATDAKVGGVNYGAIEWDAQLQADAIREFLKGGKYLGSADYAQDESGYNYREMYQMATANNNIPANTNLELVLDADSLDLVGVSEAGTGKTIEFQRNPNVSVSWCKQLRLENEEAGYNYYCSYGVQYNGTVKIYTAADLETTEGQDEVIDLFDTYYPTLSTVWSGYSAGFKDLTDPAEIRAAKLAYAKKTIEGGRSLVYKIVPTKIVVTAPFLMNMIPQMANGLTFTSVHEGEDKYAYDLDIRDEFLDELVAYKAAYIATEEGKDAVNAYYTSAMFSQIDGMCKQMGMPTNLETALNPNNAAGLKTQTTWTPGK